MCGNSLWHSLIVAKYDEQLLVWRMNPIGHKKMLVLWRKIVELFPRLFSLAVNAMAFVYEYAVEVSFVHDNWSLFFRRELRVFEVQQLGELVAIVSRFLLGAIGVDRLIWKPSPMGQFSMGLLYKLMTLFGLQKDSCLGYIWRVKGSSLARVGVCWVPQSPGVLKFNVDGSVFGSFGKAGCGGVLRDDKGHILALFSGPLGSIDFNEAEVQLIVHALVVLLESKWRSHPFVVIESDSVVAVSWVMHLERRSWKCWRTTNEKDSA
ncbi:hypothetical protein V6N12_058196 [Hibiscus sabdariffa]|uniref:RNase H type-1 domain-containing protein n=1 Tax=Hibiscus sabdariffa TaxID=183260 RepID=A0ABR2ERI5_9ROSI